MAHYKRADNADDGQSLTSIPVADDYNLRSPTVQFRSFPGQQPRKVLAQAHSWWRSHTSLERKLIAFVVSLLISLILLLILFLFQWKKSFDPTISRVSQDPWAKPCLTPACVTAASSVISSMDAKADPCQDFFQFACGGWIHDNPIPEGKSMWGTFDKLWQDNQVVMRNVLELPSSSLRSAAEIKTQQYYQSCLDSNETVEALGSKPVLQLLDKVGGWALPNSSISNVTLQQTLATLHNVYNFGGFFTWAVAEDDRNSTRHILQLDQGGLTLPTRDYYLNKTDTDEVLVAYLDYMTKLGVLLGGEETLMRAMMKDILELETRIAEITIKASDRRDEEKLYHTLTLGELQNLAPFIDWLEYFRVAFSQVNITVTVNETIVNYAPEYLKNLTVIVQEYQSAENGSKVLHNYLLWHTLRTMAPYLPKTFRDAGKVLRKVLMGTTGQEETWRYCVSDTNNVLGFALGAMFVRKTFHGEAKPLAEAMITAVRTAFTSNFPNLSWMDEETRQAAKEKADAIADMIGFPKYILNSEELDRQYEDLVIKPEEYFENNVRSNQYVLKQNLVKLNQPVNKTTWGMTPPTVNAYYTPNKNQIVFPAGILQKPFFALEFPASLNFGAMGVVMGHELTHAFDDQGREFDKHGDLHPWWNNDTIGRFQERTQCMVDQYSNYTINNDTLNGKQTLGENIADNGGLKAAFNAYRLWITENNLTEQPLPGLNYTHNQLFFISFAQVWCSSLSKEALHLQILNDPHTTARFRVMGPLTNSEEFAQQFNCPNGSPMNPTSKCEIW